MTGREAIELIRKLFPGDAYERALAVIASQVELGTGIREAIQNARDAERTRVSVNEARIIAAMR